MVVAIAVGRSGIDTLLVASQVVLSIVLPFITFPLLYCTSSKAVMRVAIPKATPTSVTVDTATSTLTPDSASAIGATTAVAVRGNTGADLEHAPKDEVVDYSNGKIAIGIGAAIWLIVVAANMYVIVSLAMGNEG